MTGAGIFFGLALVAGAIERLAKAIEKHNEPRQP